MTDLGRLTLSTEDQAKLDGEAGPAYQLAMSLVVRAANLMEASELVDVSFVHIDACFYGGEAHVDFAKFLVEHEARFPVPAWTNNGLVSLEDASLRSESEHAETVRGARELMHLYATLGCRTVWTCAPYQLPDGPGLGDQIVGSESNAVTYYNAVVGARTNKYGDFLEVACGLVGRVPLARLHTDAGRRGQRVFDLRNIPEEIRRTDLFYPVLGYYIGRNAENVIPVIDGVPTSATNDDLKAVSAAVAASGVYARVWTR